MASRETGPTWSWSMAPNPSTRLGYADRLRLGVGQGRLDDRVAVPVGQLAGGEQGRA